MIHEGIEAEPERRELRKAFAYAGIAQPPLRPGERGAPPGLVRIARRDEADAAEAAAAGHYHRLQHLGHARAQRQLAVADDAGADARPAVAAAGAHRRHAIGELDLTHGAHLGEPIRALR